MDRRQASCEDGRWYIKEPISKPGDYIEFRAEMDLLVGFSNCSEDRLTDCHARNCPPMQVEVLEL